MGRAVPFNWTTEEGTKLLPRIVTVVAAEPIAIVVGVIELRTGMGFAEMLKFAAADVPPEVLFTTVIGRVATAVSIDAGTVVAMEVPEVNVVVSSVVPSTATQDVVKPEPKIRTEVSGEFTYTELGFIEPIAGGAPALTLNDIAVETPPPGVGFVTVTCAVEMAAISAPVMLAVNLLDDVKVVVLSDPFQRTTEAGTNPLPFTVKVNAWPPTIALSGDRDAMAGTPYWMFSGTVPEVPPPGVGVVTEMLETPVDVRSAAVTAVRSSVELM